MRFILLLATKVSVIVSVSVYLANTFHSQSFSLSQRFDPTQTLWFCFAPQPPVGFRPSEIFPLNQLPHLSMIHPLMSLSVTDGHKGR
jgi:hypothetical protein